MRTWRMAMIVVVMMLMCMQAMAWPNIGHFTEQSIIERGGTVDPDAPAIDVSVTTDGVGQPMARVGFDAWRMVKGLVNVFNIKNWFTGETLRTGASGRAFAADLAVNTLKVGAMYGLYEAGDRYLWNADKYEDKSEDTGYMNGPSTATGPGSIDLRGATIDGNAILDTTNSGVDARGATFKGNLKLSTAAEG